MNRIKTGIIYNEPVIQGNPNWKSSADILEQVKAVEASLQALGHMPVLIPFTRDIASFARQVSEHNVQLAFNLCESVDEDPLLTGHPAAMLELLNIPFTGSPSAALQLSTDKLLVKLLLRSVGINTPRFSHYHGGAWSCPSDLKFPVIIKPVHQDASIGIDQESVIKGPEKLCEILKEFYMKYGPILVEEFVDGREFNVSILGFPEPGVLPLAEIDFSSFPEGLHRIVGYSAKWVESSFEYHHTGRFFPESLPENLKEAVQKIALDCFNLLGVRDYGRVDLRIDRLDRVSILEVNANPCLSPDAGFTAAAQKAGLTYIDLVDRLIRFAWKRRNS